MKARINSIISLIFWGITSLYLGIGGCLKTENYNFVSGQYNFNDTTKVIDISNDLPYSNYAELKLANEDNKSAKIFPFLSIIPGYMGLILTACFFGMLGGIISILKDIALENIKPEDTKYFSIPLLSFFTGLVILGINYIIPTILVIGENKIRPITLLFLSLFAGIYTRQFYQFISSIIKTKIFNYEN